MAHIVYELDIIPDSYGLDWIGSAKMDPFPILGHPVYAVGFQLWPVLSKTAEKYASDMQVTERLFRCIRYALRCLGKHLNTLFNPVLTQVGTDVLRREITEGRLESQLHLRIFFRIMFMNEILPQLFSPP